ncbi:hypothetical protein SFRURICE_017565 [Spodoptera frugiperda]|nr:hypothetical protein SFRURICE_017565 [Spodoptera frugiperda]
MFVSQSDCTFGAVAGQPAVAQRVAGSTPSFYNPLWDLQIVVSVLSVINLILEEPLALETFS